MTYLTLTKLSDTHLEEPDPDQFADPDKKVCEPCGGTGGVLNFYRNPLWICIHCRGEGAVYV